MPEQDTHDALLRFLVKHGRLSPTVIDAVVAYRHANDVSWVEALCDGGFVDELSITELFEEALRLPHVNPVAAPQLARPLDGDLLRHRLVAPAELTNGHLVLAMANPLDYDTVRLVRFASGLRVTPAVATLSEIRDALSKRGVLTKRGAAVEAASSAANAPSPEPGRAPSDADQQAALASKSPIVKMATLLIEQGISLSASDIHLEPTADGLTVRYRIDGVLEEATRLSTSVRGPLVARLKVMANLDIAERRIPQDGGIALTVDGRKIDCRVSTLPTQYGEKVVIRLLDAARALTRLDQLGFEPDELAQVEACLHQSEGMILTTGPTGSGKSTTLYAMLQAILSPEVNIVTVENPIEYRLAGINQTEVNERQGMTFAAALRSILRQDPDVILVGEIRDRETAEIAIQAAQTGHLVLSTLHTNDAVGAVTRLAKLGVDRELIASSVLPIIAQRLVRRNCLRCSAPAPLSTWSHIAWHKAIGMSEISRGQGCPECRNTGYRGRLGVYEIFRNTLEAKRLIAGDASEVELRDLLRREGSRTLMQVALDKVRRGLTTPDEVAQVIKSDEGMRTCVGCGSGLDERFHTCPYCGLALRSECPGCGAPLREDWERCPNCGLVIGRAAEAPSRELQAMAVELQAPKTLAVGSVLGAGVRGLCVASGLDEVGASELELAVVEACGLACSAGTSGDLHIALEMAPEGYSICLSDEGPPWAWPRPSAKPPNLEAFGAEATPDVRAFLIRSSVDEASYERVERGNRLWLIKRPLREALLRGADEAEPARMPH